MNEDQKRKKTKQFKRGGDYNLGFRVQHQFHPLHKGRLACSDEVRKQELKNSKTESIKRNNIIGYSTVNIIQGFYRQACLLFR